MMAGLTNAVSGSNAGTTQFTLGSATAVLGTTASFVLQSAMTTSLVVTVQASGQYLASSCVNPWPTMPAGSTSELLMKIALTGPPLDSTMTASAISTPAFL